MIGHVIMEIEPDEMRAAVQFYLNRDVFDANSIRERHKAKVSAVRQRSNGNFVIEFYGWFLPEEKTDDSSNDIS